MNWRILNQDTLSTWVARALAAGVKVIVVLAVTAVCLLIAKFLIAKVQEHWQHQPSDSEAHKRAETLGTILWKVMKFAIWSLAILMTLSEIGINLGPILATAGIAGLAVGFGSQTLVKDVLGGFLLLMENQVLLGDIVQIGDSKGCVEKISLRTLTLRDLNGNIHIIPHGTIERVINKTREYSYSVLDISVDYREDTDRVMQVLQNIAEELSKDPTFQDMVLEPAEILGVDKLGDSGVVIKMRIKTKPGQQWRVFREMNRRIKKDFENENIEMPYPRMTIQVAQQEENKDASLKPRENSAPQSH